MTAAPEQDHLKPDPHAWAEGIYQKLKKRGVFLRVCGGDLQVSDRACPLTEKEKAILQNRKAFLIPVVERRQAEARLRAMRLDGFAISGRTVRIYSDVLGEEVIFAADNAPVIEGTLNAGSRAVYRASELALLIRPHPIAPEDLQLLHAARQEFGGKVVRE